jgi:hypothetical protein
MHDLIIVLAFIGMMITPAVMMAKVETQKHRHAATK